MDRSAGFRRVAESCHPAGRAAKTGDAFTFTTREDGEMVRNIERVLGNRVERRTLDGFDYKKPMPGGDIFSRPPREPQMRGERKVAKPSGYRAATSASRNKYGGGREGKRGSGGKEGRRIGP